VAVQVDLWDLLLDDANTAKMHAHGVTVRHADEVLDRDPRVLRNHAADGAALLVVGTDASGRFLTMPIDPTAEHGVWRPRTAYPSKPSDIARYRRLRS
jgi:hypothetical protein